METTQMAETVNFYERPIFAGLTKAEVDELVSHAKRLSFAPGDVIFAEGLDNPCLDLIHEGELEISKRDADGHDRAFASIGVNSVVGELSLMTGSKRTCTGRALSPLVLYRISHADFEALLDSNTPAAFKVVRNLASVLATRLRNVDDKLIALMRGEQPTSKGAEFSHFRNRLFTEWGF